MNASQRAQQIFLVTGVWFFAWFMTSLVLREPLRMLHSAVGTDPAMQQPISMLVAFIVAIVVARAIWMLFDSARPAVAHEQPGAKTPITAKAGRTLPFTAR